MYGLTGFAENSNIQKYVNSTVNCVHQMYKLSGFAKKFKFCGYVGCTELQKFNANTIDVRIVWIWRKFEYLELHKFN